MTTPTFDFDLFVIGGGSGGVRAARMAAGRGGRRQLDQRIPWRNGRGAPGAAGAQHDPTEQGDEFPRPQNLVAPHAPRPGEYDVLVTRQADTHGRQETADDQT